MQLMIAVLGAAVPVAVGAFVLSRLPRHAIGRLLVVHGVCFFAVLAWEGTSTTGIGLVVDQLASGAWVLLFVWLVVAAYLLPDGRAINPFWRNWLRVGVVGVLVFIVGAAGDRGGFIEAHRGTPPPVPWLPETVSGALGIAGLLVVALLILGCPVAVWWRLRRATADERLQLLWVVWGALTIPVTLVTGWVNFLVLDDGPLFPAALALLAVGLPASIGVAVLRYRMFDVRVVLSRTLTYLLLVVAVLGTYALLLFVTNRLLGQSSIGGLVAVGVVAVTVHPTYSAARRRIEHLVYGLRSDPRTALRLLAQRADAADPDGLVAAVTDAVAAALRVDQVWVEQVRVETGRVETGTKGPPDALRTPMMYRGEQVANLAIYVPPGREFDAADRELVADLARYSAILVRAQELNDDLRESRTRIVAGREEERRRLRRDLHDGLGPTLAAVVLKLNATESRDEDGERQVLVREARDEIKAAVADVRRLVDDLRPPAIDEVGLIGAIRQRAAALSGDVTFEVTGPPGLPTLPAAVEVAAFRIASEAMTNVVRHSGATRCKVDVDVNGAFALTVTDNGHGAAHGTTSGVGWTSMRERAAELGGSCTVSARSDGGLVVCAVLPLDEVAAVTAAAEGAHA